MVQTTPLAVSDHYVLTSHLLWHTSPKASHSTVNPGIEQEQSRLVAETEMLPDGS